MERAFYKLEQFGERQALTAVDPLQTGPHYDDKTVMNTDAVLGLHYSPYHAARRKPHFSSSRWPNWDTLTNCALNQMKCREMYNMGSVLVCTIVTYGVSNTEELKG